MMESLSHSFSAIEETGSIPYEILRPVLEVCSQAQLARIESKNEVDFLVVLIN